MTDTQNIDGNECFKWCLVKYLHPADHYPAGIAKAYNCFSKIHNFQDIKFPVKTVDIHKIEIKNSNGISVFGYENKEQYLIYVSKKCCEDKHVDLLLIGGRMKSLVKDFNTFMYDHTLHCRRKHFLSLQFTKF